MGKAVNPAPLRTRGVCAPGALAPRHASPMPAQHVFPRRGFFPLGWVSQGRRALLHSEWPPPSLPSPPWVSPWEKWQPLQEKIYQRGDVEADGMAMRLVVPGSWDGTRSRNWVWRPRGLRWGAGTAGVVPSTRLRTDGEQGPEEDQPVLSHCPTRPGPLTGWETREGKSAPKWETWTGWLWSRPESQEAKSSTSKSVKPTTHLCASQAKGCWEVARVALVSPLPVPLPPIAAEKGREVAPQQHPQWGRKSNAFK